MVVMMAGIRISPKIFAIGGLTALNRVENMIASMFCDCYDHMETRLYTEELFSLW